MIVYISSPFNGGLFCLCTDTGRVDTLQEYHGTGLCMHKGMFYQAVGGDSVNVLAPSGQLKRTHYLGNNYYHDLFVWEDGFGLVNTKRSWLEQYDDQFNLIATYPELYPGAARVDDGCHFNSARLKGDLIYGTCFIMSNKSKGYRKGNDTNGQVFVQNNYVVPIIDQLLRPHSIRLLSDRIVLCDSLRSEIVLYTYAGDEIERLQVKTVEGHIGFARGLLRVDGGWLVGLSSPRHGDTRENWVLFGHVVQIADTGEVVNSWKLPCFEVYDIATRT